MEIKTQVKWFVHIANNTCLSNSLSIWLRTISHSNAFILCSVKVFLCSYILIIRISSTAANIPLHSQTIVTHPLPILGRVGPFRFSTALNNAALYFVVIVVVLLLCFLLLNYFPGGHYWVKGYRHLYILNYLCYWIILSHCILKENIIFFPQYPVRGIRQALVHSPVKTALCPSSCLGMPQGHMRLPENDLWHNRE